MWITFSLVYTEAYKSQARLWLDTPKCSLISWCVHVVFMECQGKLEELKHKKPFKTQGPLSPLVKFALIRCWLHFTSWTWAPRSARHTEPEQAQQEGKTTKAKLYLAWGYSLPLVSLPRWWDVLTWPESKITEIEKSNATRRKREQCKLPVVLCMLSHPPSLISICKDSEMENVPLIITPLFFLKASLWTFKSPQVSGPLFLPLSFSLSLSPFFI